MTHNQIANCQIPTSPAAKITNSIANGKNVPIITVTGGIVALAFVGLLAYSIYKGVHTNVSIKNGLNVSFSPEPDIQLAYIEDGISLDELI